VWTRILTISGEMANIVNQPSATTYRTFGLADLMHQPDARAANPSSAPTHR